MNFIEIENKLINLDNVTDMYTSDSNLYIYMVGNGGERCNFHIIDDPDGKIYNMLKETVMRKDENGK